MERLTDSIGPTLRTRRVGIRPLEAEDWEFLYALAVDPEIGYRWRYAGTLPTFDEFRATFSQDVLSTIICDTAAGDRIGFATVYSPQPMHRHCYFAAVFAKNTAAPLGAEAGIVAMNFLFHTWSFDRVYMEIPEFNHSQVKSMESRQLASVEAHYRNHQYYAGRLWDKYVYVVTRDEHLPRIAAQLERLV